MRTTLVAALAVVTSGCWVVHHGHDATRRHRVEVIELAGRQAVIRDGRAEPGFDAIGVCVESCQSHR